jgi:ribosomal protein S18
MHKNTRDENRTPKRCKFSKKTAKKIFTQNQKINLTVKNIAILKKFVKCRKKKKGTPYVA